MKITVVRTAISCLLTLTFIGRVARAQQRPDDRRPFLDPSTPVSDDPRRIPVPAGYGAPEGSVVLSGGRIFDGTGQPTRPGTIVVEGNTITAILAPGSTDWPANARVLDVEGKTVLPGLIDLHTHLTYTELDVPTSIGLSAADQTLRALERLRYYLESGVTSVRDVASAGDVPFRLKAWVAQHRIPGPRIFAAGQLITGTGGHGAEGLDIHDPGYGSIREASGPDDWREAVREQFKAGADVIKIASHFTSDEAAAAVSEAHTLGVKVTADAETIYIRRAVEAGVDIIEHPLPRSEETIRLMAERGTGAVPTLIPYIYIFDQWGGYFGSSSRRFTFSKQANLDMLRRMKDAGIRMGIGTDLILDWFRYLPDPYITELEQFVAVGYSVPEALMAATKTGADLLDMGDRLGTVEPGKLADVLVVAGRPDSRLRDLANVDIVMRNGEIVVEGGRVVIPRHVPVPVPPPSETPIPAR